MLCRLGSLRAAQLQELRGRDAQQSGEGEQVADPQLQGAVEQSFEIPAPPIAASTSRMCMREAEQLAQLFQILVGHDGGQLYGGLYAVRNPTRSVRRSLTSPARSEQDDRPGGHHLQCSNTNLSIFAPTLNQAIGYDYFPIGRTRLEW